MPLLNKLRIRQLPQLPYAEVWQRMRNFTDQRNAETIDEIWLLEHPPVFTQGQSGKAEHILNPHDIPIIETDRGGQVTYHGPGQLIGYFLIDLKRLNLGIRTLVQRLEQCVIHLLAEYDINAMGRRDAPGVYVDDAKICSIGLRVRHGATYHGIALNVNMELTPFSYINPCGFQGLTMTQIKDFIPAVALSEIRTKMVPHLVNTLGYDTFTET